MTFDKHFKLPKYIKRFIFTESFTPEQRKLFKEAHLAKIFHGRNSLRSKSSIDEKQLDPID